MESLRRAGGGTIPGTEVIDPVWAKIVAYGADEVPKTQRKATRELIETCLKSKPDGAALLGRFDALGDQ